MECFSYKGRHGWHRCTCIKPLKEELAWAVGKQLWVISTIMLFKNSKITKELKELAVLILCTLLCGP